MSPKPPTKVFVLQKNRFYDKLANFSDCANAKSVPDQGFC